MYQSYLGNNGSYGPYNILLQVVYSQMSRVGGPGGYRPPVAMKKRIYFFLGVSSEAEVKTISFEELVDTWAEHPPGSAQDPHPPAAHPPAAHPPPAHPLAAHPHALDPGSTRIVQLESTIHDLSQSLIALTNRVTALEQSGQ